MNFDQLLILIDTAVYAKANKHLRDIDVLVLRESLLGKSYDEIAEANNYTGQYLRQDVGPKLWQLLSVVVEEKITKKSCRSALERYWQIHFSPQAQILTQSNGTSATITPKETMPTNGLDHAVNPHSPKTDWGEAIDSSVFYGRVEELKLLKQWINSDRCRLVALLGMGGIGKTTLSVKLAEEIQGQFEYIFWRSLRNARPLSDLLRVFFDFIGEAELLRESVGLEEQLNRLMRFLQQHRCLIVLDNLETILAGGTVAGAYTPGYDDYGQLIRRVADSVHQSCLLLTSREKPIGFAQREGYDCPTRALSLTGLTLEDAESILKDKGVQQLDLNALQVVLNHYGGNPLALKIMASGVVELGGGDLSTVVPFLNQGMLQFKDIDDLLGRQFSRLNPVELQVMYWLALNREPMTLMQLGQDIFRPNIARQLPEAVQSLNRRSLLERSGAQLSLQPVVMEFVAQRFIESIAEEIAHNQYSMLQTYALLKAQAKDMIREAQQRFVIAPLLSRLDEECKGRDALAKHLKAFLDRLRQVVPGQPGYACGNLLNLLRHLTGSLTHLDCSQLSVWQAYLVGIPLHQVNFNHADFSKSVFTNVLSTTLALTFSPDGQYFALGNADNSIRVWTVVDYQELLICKGHSNWVSTVAFCDQGRMLVSGSLDKTLRLWDLETGQCLKTLTGHQGWVWSVVFDPVSNRIASASDDHTIRLWDLATGDCLQILEGHRSTVWALAFSPDGQLLASSGGDGAIKLWTLSTGEFQDLVSPLPENRSRTLAFSPDGQILATGGLNCHAELWCTRNRTHLLTLRGHARPITCLAVGTDFSDAAASSGRLLATGSQECVLRLWDMTTGKCLKTLEGHPNGIWSLALHPTQPLLISGSSDSTLKLWNTETGESIRTLLGYGSGIKAIALSPDKTRLVSAGDSAVITVRHLETQSIQYSLKGHASWIWSLAFTPDGTCIVSSSNDNTLKLWDLTSGALIRTFMGHVSLVYSVAIGADARLIASGSDDNTVRLWNLESGDCLYTLPHRGRVWSVALSPDCQMLACGNQETLVSLWDLGTQEMIQTFVGHTSLVFAIAFNPTGNWVVSGSDDGTAKLWDVLTGKCLQTFEGHQGAIWTVAFSPEGQWVATGSHDHTVRLWDASSGACQQILYGHHSAVWSLVFSAEAQVISGSQEGTIKVWDLESSRCVETIQDVRPYEGMKIAAATGLTDAQRTSLMTLGAVSSPL